MYGAVVNHFAVLVAPRRVHHLPHRAFIHIARDDAIDHARRVFALKNIFVQRRRIEQSRRIANRPIFAFGREFIRTRDNIFAPASPVVRLTEVRSARMKWSSGENHGRNPNCCEMRAAACFTRGASCLITLSVKRVRGPPMLMAAMTWAS